MRHRRFKAVILDLDGVVTRTAHLHAQAWKRMFDAFLEGRGEEPFDIGRDYRRYVDGIPRYEGARRFLESRGIELPFGDPRDAPGDETICALGNRKNELFHELLAEKGPEVYDDAVEQIEVWREHGLKTALITSSRNGATIVDTAGIGHLFDTIIDGVEAAELEIPGKPAPDVFLEAARRLHVEPGDAIVIEDAVSGVQAGRAGDFGLVAGVARNGGDDLREYADLVVDDLRRIPISD